MIIEKLDFWNPQVLHYYFESGFHQAIINNDNYFSLIAEKQLRNMKLNSSIIPQSVKGKIEPKFPSETGNVTNKDHFCLVKKM